MNEIVVDIETIPGKLGPEATKIANERCARKRGDNKDIYRYCSLRPEFGCIVAIGIGGAANLYENGIGVITGDERKILSQFWGLMNALKDFKMVTFNGKSFDVPYIIKRSAFLGIPPSVRISTRRYDTQFHFDCLEVLTNYFQSDKSDRFSLKDYCQMFGIENRDDTDGGDIYPLWLKGDIAAIEKHCASDVQATLALYQKIKGYY